MHRTERTIPFEVVKFASDELERLLIETARKELQKPIDPSFKPILTKDEYGTWLVYFKIDDSRPPGGALRGTSAER